MTFFSCNSGERARFTVPANDSLMKTTLLSRIAITLGLAVAVSAPLSLRADDTQKPATDNTETAKHGHHGKIREMILKKFDTNHNGKLDPDERAALKKWLEERHGKRGSKAAA
jgi:hypothetical protein